MTTLKCRQCVQPVIEHKHPKTEFSFSFCADIFCFDSSRSYNLYVKVIYQTQVTMVRWLHLLKVKLSPQSN